MASPTSPSSSHASGSMEAREPDLGELVNFFVSSKRSLSSASHVWRANEVVNSARELLEENAVLAAKNTFLRSAVQEQTGVLDSLRQGMEEVGQRAQDEYRDILKDLDQADINLKTVLKSLRQTPLSRTLQSASSPDKFLGEFINTDDYDERHAILRGCIDRYNSANDDFRDINDEFDAQLESLRNSLAPVRSPGAEPRQSNDPSPLPHLFRALETHATEIAANLQSLVHHYDLCVQALKHTEGGLPAASLATGEQDIPTAEGITVESLHQDAPPAPMTPSERLDMLRVVAKDASEVEEVVVELRERASEMETQLESMSSHISLLREEHQNLLSAVNALHDMSKDVRRYVDAAKAFSIKWDEEKENMIQGYHEFHGLREFFQGFLSAYDDLLVEKARRDKIRRKMEDIAREAEKKIAKLYSDDAEARSVFHQRKGIYLPADIWPELTKPPVRYQITEAPSVGEESPQQQQPTGESNVPVEGNV